MSDQPLTGTTPGYDEAEKIIHTIIFDVVLNTVIAQVISAIPWLGFPVIKQVFLYITERLLALVYAAMEKAVASYLIDAKVTAERKAYETAVQTLKEQLSRPERNPDDLAKADAEFRARFNDLISMRP